MPISAMFIALPALNVEVCREGETFSGIVIRITSLNISVDWVRTIPSRFATSVAMVLLPLPGAPPINRNKGVLFSRINLHSR